MLINSCFGHLLIHEVLHDHKAQNNWYVICMLHFLFFFKISFNNYLRTSNINWKRKSSFSRKLENKISHSAIIQFDLNRRDLKLLKDLAMFLPYYILIAHTILLKWNRQHFRCGRIYYYPIKSSREWTV